VVKEFEHIHNKAIFDSFNEVLNFERPHYQFGGQPYYWTVSRLKIVKKHRSELKVSKLIDSSIAIVLKFSRFLCGLLTEVPAYEPAMLANRKECETQNTRDEIQFNEYRWQLMEDEKTEVLLELADLIFEELIEEIIVL